MDAGNVSLDEVLSNVGVGWFHIRLWWISGFGFAAAAIEVCLMSFIFPVLRGAPWFLDEFELGGLAMLVSSGSIFGEIIFGLMADKYGRKNIFMLTVCIVVVFGLLSALSTSVWMLGALRFCVGFGYGGNIAVDFTMYSEFLPTQGRGKMLFLLTGFWPLGQVFACAIAWTLIPWKGWQVFLAACTIPSLITACFRPFIPESPRWLLIQGRTEEAKEVCLQMAALNGKSASDIGLDGKHELCLANENSTLEGVQQAAATDAYSMIMKLFGPALWRTTAGLFIIVISLNATGYGTLTLMPSLLAMKGVPQNKTFRTMLLNSCAQLPGVAIGTWVATNYGRLPPLKLSIFFCGAGLFGFAYARDEDAVLACTMFASCFLETGWCLYHVYVPEAYPTELRAMATGILSASGSVVNMAVPLMSAVLMERKSPVAAILSFATIAICAGIGTSALLNVETKDRDLVDITSPISGPKIP